MRELYKRYESGASLRNLKDWLEENQIKTVLGESKWTATSIKSILTNEKYCGDVLLQKTFRTDVISKKVIKNVGQMAQYYMPDHHEAIVSREQYNAVKAECPVQPVQNGCDRTLLLYKQIRFIGQTRVR